MPRDIVTGGDAVDPGSGGTDGKTIHTVAGVPGGALGVDGDYAINPGTSELYGPKTAGAWGAPTSLIGPQGSPASEVNYAEVTATVPLSNTVADIPNLNIEFTMPNRPVMLECFLPAVTVSVAQKSIFLQTIKVSGAATGVADGAAIATTSHNFPYASLSQEVIGKKRLDPATYIPGTSYVFKMVANVQTAGTTGSIIASAASPGYFRAD